LFPALYAILDPALTSASVFALTDKLVGAGVRLVQLRDKRATARTLCHQVRELAARLAPGGGRLILNDRPDIAAICGAGGVHVGQEDLPIEATRRICSEALWVGVSTHNMDQLRAAAGSSADYIAVGPVFRTSSKEKPDPVVGLEFLRMARRETRKPLVAIGGITVESAGDVYRAGADSVAVIRDLLGAPDPGARARQYLVIAERELSART
jgi:thiamine-phosphate pyrophosphorylase